MSASESGSEVPVIGANSDVDITTVETQAEPRRIGASEPLHPRFFDNDCPDFVFDGVCIRRGCSAQHNVVQHALLKDGYITAFELLAPTTPARLNMRSPLVDPQPLVFNSILPASSSKLRLSCPPVRFYPSRSQSFFTLEAGRPLLVSCSRTGAKAAMQLGEFAGVLVEEGLAIAGMERPPLPAESDGSSGAPLASFHVLWDLDSTLPDLRRYFAGSNDHDVQDRAEGADEQAGVSSAASAARAPASTPASGRDSVEESGLLDSVKHVLWALGDMVALLPIGVTLPRPGSAQSGFQFQRQTGADNRKEARPHVECLFFVREPEENTTNAALVSPAATPATGVLQRDSAPCAAAPKPRPLLQQRHSCLGAGPLTPPLSPSLARSGTSSSSSTPQSPRSFALSAVSAASATAEASDPGDCTQPLSAATVAGLQRIAGTGDQAEPPLPQSAKHVRRAPSEEALVAAMQQALRKLGQRFAPAAAPASHIVVLITNRATPLACLPSDGAAGSPSSDSPLHAQLTALGAQLDTLAALPGVQTLVVHATQPHPALAACSLSHVAAQVLASGRVDSAGTAGDAGSAPPVPVLVDADATASSPAARLFEHGFPKRHRLLWATLLAHARARRFPFPKLESMIAAVRERRQTAEAEAGTVAEAVDPAPAVTAPNGVLPTSRDKTTRMELSQTLRAAESAVYQQLTRDLDAWFTWKREYFDLWKARHNILLLTPGSVADPAPSAASATNATAIRVLSGGSLLKAKAGRASAVTASPSGSSPPKPAKEAPAGSSSASWEPVHSFSLPFVLSGSTAKPLEIHRLQALTELRRVALQKYSSASVKAWLQTGTRSCKAIAMHADSPDFFPQLVVRPVQAGMVADATNPSGQKTPQSTGESPRTITLNGMYFPGTDGVNGCVVVMYPPGYRAGPDGSAILIAAPPSSHAPTASDPQQQSSGSDADGEVPPFPSLSDKNDSSTAPSAQGETEAASEPTPAAENGIGPCPPYPSDACAPHQTPPQEHMPSIDTSTRLAAPGAPVHTIEETLMTLCMTNMQTMAALQRVGRVLEAQSVALQQQQRQQQQMQMQFRGPVIPAPHGPLIQGLPAMGMLPGASHGAFMPYGSVAMIPQPFGMYPQPGVGMGMGPRFTPAMHPMMGALGPQRMQTSPMGDPMGLLSQMFGFLANAAQGTLPTASQPAVDINMEVDSAGAPVATSDGHSSESPPPVSSDHADNVPETVAAFSTEAEVVNTPSEPTPSDHEPKTPARRSKTGVGKAAKAAAVARNKRSTSENNRSTPGSAASKPSEPMSPFSLAPKQVRRTAAVNSEPSTPQATPVVSDQCNAKNIVAEMVSTCFPSPPRRPKAPQVISTIWKPYSTATAFDGSDDAPVVETAPAAAAGQPRTAQRAKKDAAEPTSAEKAGRRKRSAPRSNVPDSQELLAATLVDGAPAGAALVPHYGKAKTMLCIAWMETAALGIPACKFGDACAFAHGESQLRRGTYKVIMCRNMMSSGTCSSGQACSYAHSETELRRYPPSVTQQKRHSPK
jgi:hypothetical protein